MEIAVLRQEHSRAGSFDLSSSPFSAVLSDHLFSAVFADGQWADFSVRPYHDFAISPTSSALQYGVSVFEGLKAHRGADGRVRLFRPEMNAARFRRSATRLAMAPVPDELFLNALRELLEVDDAWVPGLGEGALYIRPFLYSEDASVRVKPAEKFRFAIVTFPFANYFSAPVKVMVTEKFTRAFPGGTGDIKPAGNYAPALLADAEARAEGFDTVMWLDGISRRYVEECGVMNVFFVLGNRVVTPSLSGTILPGVTRDSVITLLRESGRVVEERRISIDEIMTAASSGELLECFGTGTAATVSHVGSIKYRDTLIELPQVESRRIGPAVREELVEIMNGQRPDIHNWVTII